MILLRKLITLVAVSVVCSKGSYPEDDALPALVFDEGDTALVPCIKEANENDFFWSKGKWYDNGTNIAYIARGIPSKSNKYDVHIDGTLVIRDISLADEGNYFCRILSDLTESYVGVRIYVRVSAEALDIAIEGCTSSSSCVKVLEPSLESHLTCTANLISESMTLKWYNGTKEIVGDVHIPESVGQKVKITNVIKFILEAESHLTCQAEGVNIAKSMAVIQLKKKEVAHEATMTLLVPTIVLGIICLILTGILICLIVCYRKPDKEQGKVKDAHSVEMSVTGVEQEEDKKEGQNAEKDSLLTSKGKNDPNLTTSEKELQRLQAKMKEMKETEKALEEKNRELELAKEDLKKKENEANNLQNDLREENTKLSAAEDENKKLKEELAGANAKLFETTNEKKKLIEDLGVANNKLSESTNETKKQKEDLGVASTKLLESANETKKLKEDLAGANAKLVESTNQQKKLKAELGVANSKLVESTNETKKLKEDLGAANTKLVESTNEKTSIISKITELKNKTLRYIPKTSPRVIICVKGVHSKSFPSYEEVMPKSKYGNISLVSGPSYLNDILAQIKDNLERTCLIGKDTYIFLFGGVESGLQHTLHGEKDNKGFIERVANLISVLSSQLKKGGFQVKIHVSTTSATGEGKALRFVSPSEKATDMDKLQTKKGVEITLKKYSVQSEQSLLRVASFMTPNSSYPRDYGLLKITVEVLLASTMVYTGSIIIASITNVIKIPKVFQGKLEDNFEEVLYVLTRIYTGDLVLIPVVDPNQQFEPRKTFEAVKKTLDAY